MYVGSQFSSALLRCMLKCVMYYSAQDLPGDKATQWDDFVSNALAEVNRKNEITPLPVRYYHDLYWWYIRIKVVLILAIILCRCRLNLVFGMVRVEVMSVCMFSDFLNGCVDSGNECVLVYYLWVNFDDR